MITTSEERNSQRCNKALHDHFEINFYYRNSIFAQPVEIIRLYG
jgi:hypothetical protein